MPYEISRANLQDVRKQVQEALNELDTLVAAAADGNLIWEGVWQEGQQYTAGPKRSVVYVDGSAFVCVSDHTSTQNNQPIPLKSSTPT